MVGLDRFAAGFGCSIHVRSARMQSTQSSADIFRIVLMIGLTIIRIFRMVDGSIVWQRIRT
ncbi:MAG: hypothetical protein QOH24_136 [Verrucomicrobiota bacterium]